MSLSDTEPLFYVQDSRSFVGNSVLWWGPDRCDYTTHIDRAGKYTAAEVEIMRDTDIPWPVDEVDAIWSQHVDMQNLRRTPTATARFKAEQEKRREVGRE